MIEATNLDGTAGALFSTCEDYRYTLWRVWDKNKPAVTFIMLNPSTATESVLDPTVRRCVGYAQRWGYGSLVVGNIFALRSTDPKGLYEVDDPIGPNNDEQLRKIIQDCGQVICAWGKHGAFMDRGKTVLSMIREYKEPMALKLNGDGSPAHPLYQKNDAVLIEVPL